jgi:hypothetical protein
MVARIDQLEDEAARLRIKADTLSRRYARTTWLRFVAVFVPVPFVVLLLRLDLEAWHYYVAGGAYIVFAFGLFALDTALSTKRDEAATAAERARAALEAARNALIACRAA